MRRAFLVVFVLLSLVAILFPSSLPAQTLQVSPDTQRWMEQIRDEASGPRIEQFMDLAREVSAAPVPGVPERKPQATGANSRAGERVLIFITLGPTPEASIDSTIQLISDCAELAPGAILVLRGLPAGSRTITDLVRFYRRVSDELGERRPPLILDPVRFSEYGITTSPTMLLERDGKAVARAHGNVKSDWFLRRIQAGDTGDLGTYGPVQPIAERDLIEELKERLAGIDWEEKKQGALKRFWPNQAKRFVNLPAAEKDDSFRFTPIHEFVQDLTLPDGQTLAHAGDRVNLLDYSSPTFALIAFDARDAVQVEMAKRIYQEHGSWHRPIYVTAGLPNLENGWDELTKLRGKLGGGWVYLLDDQLRQTFHLRALPCIVVADGREFLVREFKVKREE